MKRYLLAMAGLMVLIGTSTIVPMSLSSLYPCELLRWIDIYCVPTPSGHLKTSDGEHVFSVRIPQKPWPEISFPFAENYPVYCFQGNASPYGRTHFYTNTLYAVDLYSLDGSPAGDIYAVFSGKALVEDGCTHIDCGCNGGFGNNVRIVKNDGTYALYAHLSSIHVKHGQYVTEGQCIGVEGESGAAGGRHLHFSLHECDDPALLDMYQTPGLSIPFVWDIRYAEDSSYHSVGSLDLEVSKRPFCGQKKCD